MIKDREIIAARAKAYNFHTSRIYTDTFVYTAIKGWDNLSSTIKEINLKLY